MIVAHNCDPSTWEVETGETGAQEEAVSLRLALPI